MSLASKILSNTAAQIAGKAATAVISIIIIKLLTTYLGREGYGMYTTIYEFLTFFAIIADFGLFQIALREMARSPEREASILGNLLSLRLGLTVISMTVAIGAVWLLPSYAGTDIPLGVTIAVLTTFATLMTGTLSSVIQYHLKMYWAVYAAIAGRVLALGYMLLTVFVWLPANPEVGFYHLVWAGTLGNLAMLAGTYFAARKLAPIRFEFDTVFWKQVLRAALPYGTALVLATMYFRLGAVMLSLMKGPGEVGYYGVSLRIVENLQMLPVFFLNSILPTLTALLVTDREKCKQVFQTSFDVLLIVAAPIVLGGWVLAYPLISAVSSPEFLTTSTQLGSDIALRLMLVAMALAFLSNLFGYVLLAGNEQKQLLRVNLTAVALSIAVNLVVIPDYGFVGAAFTSIISESIVCGWLAYLLWKKVGLRPTFGTARKVIFAAASMGLIVAGGAALLDFAGNWGLIVLIPLGGAVYTGLLFATRAVTPDLIRAVLPGRRPANPEQPDELHA